MTKKTTDTDKIAATDQKTLDLIKEVARQKSEISKALEHRWQTNCNFSYQEDSPNVIVLHVEKDIRTLINIAAFLVSKEEGYMEVSAALGVEAPPFTWKGFGVASWLEDVKMRINKIQIASKKAKLESLEDRLNKIISPELRAEMELEAIANELG